MLDHLVDDNKVKNEILKETVELRPIEITKHVQFILRSIYSQRFLNLVIKKFQSAAAEQALLVYLGEKEGKVIRQQTVAEENQLARKQTKPSG